MTKLGLLKWLVKAARRKGFNVSGGRNGGGWYNLAVCCGIHDVRGKADARHKLTFLLGKPQVDDDIELVSAPKIHPNSDTFLESFQWRKVRMEVLKRDGARCACCGNSRLEGRIMHVDHIKPRKTHPELALDPNNLQVLCDICNHGKGNWDQTDWR